MLKAPEFLEVSIQETNGLSSNDPSFDDWYIDSLFTKTNDQTESGIRYIDYNDDFDNDFSFEIDLSLDRIQKSVFTYSDMQTRILELVKIEDVESLNF